MLVPFEARSKKRIAVLSNTITCNHSFQRTTCDLLRSGVHEDWRGTVLQGISICKVTTWVPTPNSQHGRRIRLVSMRENQPTIKANSVCTGEPVAHFSRTHGVSIPEKVRDVCTRRPVAVTLITEFQVFRTPPFSKWTQIAKKQIKNLIQQFENYPNKTSTKLKSSIRSVKSRRSWSMPTPISSWVLLHERLRQTMHFKAHDKSRKARNDKNGNCKTILERWYKDDKYRKSFSDIGWTAEQIKTVTQLHWKIIPTCLQLTIDVESRIPVQFLWTEGIQGEMNQRPDFIDAKHKCKRLYEEHTARIGEGNTPIHPAQQMRQRRAQQLEGLDEYNYTVDPRTGWIVYPSTRPTTTSSSAHWKQHDDWKSNKSWDSWRTSSWTEQ